ncbi:peroxide stress protein YaaA [Corynebacterium diphtheriae]|nr:peroxide stress protein YaaA [Corynebacterium diphtheriae]
MLIVLPPSETKAVGGKNPAIDFDSLHFPTLNPIRKEIAHDLARLDISQAQEILKLSQKLLPEAQRNIELFQSPTMPAVLRYTGVLYDALDATSLPSSTWEHLAIGSALFGVVMANDNIPHYRLSGTTKLPCADASVPTLKRRWGNDISTALSDANEVILDLRSGTYQQLGKVKHAITVRVESEDSDGKRSVISHFNKHYKGQLARALLLHDITPDPDHAVEDLIGMAQECGFAVEHSKPHELTVVITQ